MKKTEIRELAQKTFEIMKTQGYSAETLRVRHSLLFQIARFYEKYGYTEYNEDIMNVFNAENNKRYNSGAIKWNHFKNLRKSAQQISDVFHTGIISHEKFYLTPPLSAFFENLLQEILSYNEWDGKVRIRVRNFARPFFKWLISEGHTDTSSINEFVIRKYLLYCSDCYQKSSLETIRLNIKKICRFFFEIGLLSQSYEKLFLFSVGVENKILPAIPQTEIAATLSAIDRNTPVGKRNYALLLLAAVTGLRTIDIVNLKLNDIDWRNGEIKIFQEKTGAPLVLPLTADIGSSILDYVLNGRPDSNIKNVFLTIRVPIRALCQSALPALHNCCRNAAGLSNCGIHGLRRSLGRNMVVCGTPVTTIAQVLGHSNIDSAKQYISLDSIHLKECALSFKGIEPKGAVVL